MTQSISIQVDQIMPYYFTQAGFVIIIIELLELNIILIT